MGESYQPPPGSGLFRSKSFARFCTGYAGEFLSEPMNCLRASRSTSGLFGPNGPLPFHLTEFAHERLDAHRDPSLLDFWMFFITACSVSFTGRGRILAKRSILIDPQSQTIPVTLEVSSDSVYHRCSIGTQCRTGRNFFLPDDSLRRIITRKGWRQFSEKIWESQ